MKSSGTGRSRAHIMSPDICVSPPFISAFHSWLSTPECSSLMMRKWPPEASHFQSISFQIQQKDSISLLRVLAKTLRMTLCLCLLHTPTPWINYQNKWGEVGRPGLCAVLWSMYFQNQKCWKYVERWFPNRKSGGRGTKEQTNQTKTPGFPHTFSELNFSIQNIVLLGNHWCREAGRERCSMWAAAQALAGVTETGSRHSSGPFGSRIETRVSPS